MAYCARAANVCACLFGHRGLDVKALQKRPSWCSRLLSDRLTTGSGPKNNFLPKIRMCTAFEPNWLWTNKTSYRLLPGDLYSLPLRHGFIESLASEAERCNLEKLIGLIHVSHIPIRFTLSSLFLFSVGKVETTHNSFGAGYPGESCPTTEMTCLMS